MPALSEPRFLIDDFMEHERSKDLLRFSTAGSVDDGKSTLIGRLLYDTQSVYDDQIRSIEGKGTTAPGQIDFALLTDGLRAEREQGITIDVAYRYFSTPRRKFIIADTPGHEQYTRNMATGASTADAAVVLIDASKGVLIQSRRHAYIASLLRVRHVLVAVNKMDLIGYDEVSFARIERDFRKVLEQISSDTGNPVEASFVPVSALKGDNIVHRSNQMPWYEGSSLLELLETLPPSIEDRNAPFRFPVQRVTRPDHLFRGFAGQIASGSVRPGDTVCVLPSGKRAKVKSIVTWDGDLPEAHAPLSVTLTLDRELDISRGDLIGSLEKPAEVTKCFQAALVWMGQRPLKRDHRYLLKHASHTIPASIRQVEHRTNIATLDHELAGTLETNDIGVVTIDLLRSAAIDLYSENRSTGSWILIDPESNSTVAAGMITQIGAVSSVSSPLQCELEGPVSEEERVARHGHKGGVLELKGPSRFIDVVERSLFSQGALTARIDADEFSNVQHSTLVQSLIDVNTRAGILLLLATINEHEPSTATAGGVTIDITESESDAAISEVRDLLKQAEILVASEERR